MRRLLEKVFNQNRDSRLHQAQEGEVPLQEVGRVLEVALAEVDLDHLEEECQELALNQSKPQKLKSSTNVPSARQLKGSSTYTVFL